MDNNNFETLVNTFRHLSGEKIEPEMSADFSESRPSKKIEEVREIIVANKSKEDNLSAAAAKLEEKLTSEEPIYELPQKLISQPQVGSSCELSEDNDEKQLFLRNNDDKDGAGDSSSKDGDRNNSIELDLLEKDIQKSVTKSELENVDDVDNVLLRRPPAVKAQPSASAVLEDEGCGVTCLYYTLQCCDCSIM